MRSFLLSFLFSLTALALYSQHEITLLNGIVYQATEVSIDSAEVTFRYLNPKGIERQKTVDLQDVFAIRYATGQEKIIYTQGEDTADFLPVEDMRRYIEGAKTARLHYKGTGAKILAATAGFGAGVVMDSFLFGIWVPPTYALLTTAFPINAKKFPQGAAPNDPYYEMGLKKQAKKMRTSRALLSSAIGVTLGLITAGFID